MNFVMLNSVYISAIMLKSQWLWVLSDELGNVYRFDDAIWE